MFGYKTLLFLILGSCFKPSEAEADDPTLVTLPEGQIRGHILTTSNDNTYYAYQEIPYAAPPLGELRFQAPVAAPTWTGVLNTTENTKICYQGDEFFEIPGVTENEDCLYLNVYTPAIAGNSSDGLPVLVFIHGGAFLTGSGIIQFNDPQLFIDYEIVVVVINYRLGALGFLTTEDGVIPGNIGLKDQHFAIQWINRNIHLFGGDASKVVISGQSAGGASVGLQLISKRNKGLFRGAIVQSGSGLCQWSHQDYARFYAFELGKSLDPSFSSDDSRDLLKLLQNASASDINMNKITADLGKETGMLPSQGLIWLPVIEDESLEETFLTSPFHENLRTGNINQVPIVIGFTSEEQLFFWRDDPSAALTMAQLLDSDLSSIIRNKFNMTAENKLTAGRRLREVYTDGSIEDNLGSVVELSSDQEFTTPIIRHAKLQSNYTDVYMYQFSYKGKMGGLYDVEVAGIHGVGHAEELGYLWNARISANSTFDDPEDLTTRHRLLILWANFVKYLNPTPEPDKILGNITWEKVAPNNLVYLNINNTLDMQRNPKKYLQWERIVDIYAIPPLINY